MHMQQFVAALVIAALATIIALALIDGLRGRVEQPPVKVLIIEAAVLTVVMSTMMAFHKPALGWGTYVGGFSAFLAMIIIHHVGDNPANATAPQPVHRGR